jgi:nucleotide-binding universal stress UspA family protein
MAELQSIVHPTDFSEASMAAFFHALRIAVAAKASLTLLHVIAADEAREWSAFPHVRATLADWGLMKENEPTSAIAAKLGVTVKKVALAPHTTSQAVMAFLESHPADLIVLATEGRQGIARWMHDSVAEKLARTTKIPALFVPEKAKGFVDPDRGELHLRRVLVPVDREPNAQRTLGTLAELYGALGGIKPEQRLVHIGAKPPHLELPSRPGHAAPIAVRHGDVVDGIVKAATEWPPDLIAMATAGHDGFLDMLRGSTTERVLRQAPCPLLAVPA